MMSEPKIYLYTGPIRSGKTTRLLQWATDRTDVGGVLSPDAEEGRVFLSLNNGQQKVFEVQVGETENPIKVGRFVFDRAAFVWAEEEITRSLHERKKWVVIDEVGPLELNGKGLHRVVERILQSELNSNIIIVVREGLVDRVRQWLGDLVVINDLSLLVSQI